MKDNLFEMLLSLFENSLTQLQKSHKSDKNAVEDLGDSEELEAEEPSLYVKPPQEKSTRVITDIEQMKLTKASYQFLMRMKQLNVIDFDFFELILNQLLFSESRIVTLQETKWTMRNILERSLSEEQLAFLDLVLYQKEDALAVH